MYIYYFEQHKLAITLFANPMQNDIAFRVLDRKHITTCHSMPATN